jgi:hypothetical protein
MAEQRAPDPEQTDEQQAHRLLTELFSRLSVKAEDRIRHEDYTMEWPQSGERFRGCQTMKAFQDANVGSRPPRRLRRVLVRDRLWVVEGVLDYSGEREVDFVFILELRDGKVLAQITPTQR